MARLILILGGARSGKSRFAQQLAERVGGSNVLFVATAEAGDAEMSHRIAMHQASRPDAWTTREQRTSVAAVLDNAADSHPVVLIDCLTLLVSNVLLACDDQAAHNVQRAVNDEMTRLLASVGRRSGTVIVVSSEVGSGLVPENALGRMYRDLLGWANQMIAQRADATYLMVAGLAVDMKSLAATLEQAAEKCEQPEQELV